MVPLFLSLDQMVEVRFRTHKCPNSEKLTSAAARHSNYQKVNVELIINKYAYDIYNQ
jgi:hypothetical protein